MAVEIGVLVILSISCSGRVGEVCLFGGKWALFDVRGAWRFRAKCRLFRGRRAFWLRDHSLGGLWWMAFWDVGFEVFVVVVLLPVKLSRSLVKRWMFVVASGRIDRVACA